MMKLGLKFNEAIRYREHKRGEFYAQFYSAPFYLNREYWRMKDSQEVKYYPAYY
jgi:hypothetical protein